MSNKLKIILFSLSIAVLVALTFIFTNDQLPTIKTQYPDSDSLVSQFKQSQITQKSSPFISTHQKQAHIHLPDSTSITITGSDFKIKIDGVAPGSARLDSIKIQITTKTAPFILLKPAFNIGILLPPPSFLGSIYLRFSPCFIRQKTQPFIFAYTEGWGFGIGYKLFGNLNLDGLFEMTDKKLYAGLSIKL